MEAETRLEYRVTPQPLGEISDRPIAFDHANHSQAREALPNRLRPSDLLDMSNKILSLHRTIMIRVEVR